MTTDARNVQNGTAGVLGVMTQAMESRPDTTLAEALLHVAHGLARDVHPLPGGPVGIHFGAAGQAWALFEAGRVLRDPDLQRDAIDLALRQPTTWAASDMTHGIAGLGAALLRMQEHVCDPRLARATADVADALVARVEKEGGVVSWPVVAEVSGSTVRRAHYGYAHGVAGVASFLLAYGLRTGRHDCVQLAELAGDTLIEAVEEHHGTATWGPGPDEMMTPLTYWCHGTSGVGTFLVRLYEHERTDKLRAILDKCARAVMAGKWRTSFSYCHGLAGNGDFLLELADALQDDLYGRWANDLAALLLDRYTVCDDFPAFTDDWALRGVDFGIGIGGVVSFLLRLAHGGPRLWHPPLRMTGVVPAKGVHTTTSIERTER